MVLAMAVVMLQVVALVFQGIEGFVLDFPTRPARPHLDSRKFYFKNSPA
jgi:hypothetical protein